MQFPHALRTGEKGLTPEYAALMYGVNGIFSTLAVSAERFLSPSLMDSTVTLLLASDAYFAAAMSS